MTQTKLTSIGAPFTVSRVFEAPRELVWKCNAEPDRMAQWSSPEGFTTEVKRMEFRPGGVYHYCQRSPEGMEMWGKLTYRADPGAGEAGMYSVLLRSAWGHHRASAQRHMAP